MKEQLTEHVWRDGGEFFWVEHDRRHKPSPFGEAIAQELADALKEERQRSARYRLALAHYANKANWRWDGYTYYGPNYGDPKNELENGFDHARQALLQEDGEEAGE